jgi:hypothetical protein
MGPIGPNGAINLLPPEPQQTMIMTPLNDMQVLCLAASFQPVNMDAREAVERAAALLAYSIAAMQPGGVFQRFMQALSSTPPVEG